MARFRSGNHARRDYARHETTQLHGDRSLRFPDSIGKCSCGAEMRTYQDFLLHTGGSGQCLFNEGQKPRRYNLLDAL